LGSVTYDTKAEGIVSAMATGRIEKLYVHYRFQKVMKGEKIMEIYSPEIVTAQQNLLFLLQNDATNNMLINTAKERLYYLGMSDVQVTTLIKTGKLLTTITIYSKYSGHIHEAGTNSMNNNPGRMKDIATITEELPLKEGMYVQKGEPVFKVYNPDKAWVLLNIYAEDQPLFKNGNEVTITAETAPDKPFIGHIDFIEPFFRKDSKTLTARSYFDNTILKIPIGSQVKATITGNEREAFWLPIDAIVSLGMDKIVFLKQDNGFSPHKVVTGVTYKTNVQVLDGLSATDTIATNAQYLIDSESFIKSKN